MAKLLCITSGLTGILKASCAMAVGLQQEGHEVHMAAAASSGAYERNQGLTYQELPSPVMEFDRRYAMSKMPELWHWQALTNLLEREQYDLVIIDQEVHEWILYLIHHRYHFVLLSQWFPIWPNENAPSPQTSWFPGEEGRGVEEVKVSWNQLYQKRKKAAWKSNLTWKTTRRRALLYHARKLGLGQKIAPYGWPPPFRYDQFPVITMNNPGLDFAGNARPIDHWLGAQIDENRKELIDPVQLQNIRSLLSDLGDKKLLLCTLSTMDASNTQHIHRITDAVRDHADWELWITLGKKSTFDVQDMPANVRLFDYLPQLEVLRRTDVSIHHGGIHTINECIHFEVPMLVYSGGKHDQNGCAARVHYHQVGLRGNKESDTIEQVELYLSRLLNDDHFRHQLKLQNEAYQNMRRQHQASKIIGLFLPNK